MTKRMQPTTEGTWNKVADKTYKHIDGKVVRYNHNAWLWMVEGTGKGWKTLSMAQTAVELGWA